MPERIELLVGSDRLIGILSCPSSKTKGNIESCVITCHGLLASKDGPKYLFLADELCKIGITTIRFDFRGCGESEGSLIESHITNRLKDLETVMDYVINEMDAQNIGLFGSSMGGFVSYLMASSEPRVKAMVSLASPYSMTELFNAKDLMDNTYEIDGITFGSEFISDVTKHGELSEDILKAIRCPVLIFHGDADWLVPTNHAERLFNTLQSEKMLKIIKYGDHIFSNPYHLNEIVQASVNWFNKYLPGN